VPLSHYAWGLTKAFYFIIIERLSSVFRRDPTSIGFRRQRTGKKLYQSVNYDKRSASPRPELIAEGHGFRI
jgi:hypothetical protein